MPVSFSHTDMLSGDVRALVVRIAAPSLGAMLFSGGAALLDALMLSRASQSAAAAAALSFPLLTLVQTIGFTLGMGAGSHMSRCIGEGNRKDAKLAAACALQIALALSVLLCAAGLMLTAPLMRAFGAPPETLSDACEYARYVLLSAPPLCLSLVLSSLLRGQGKTLPNLCAFGLGALLGAGLEFFLILRMNWGIRGAGVAMLAREGATLIVLVFAMLRSKTLIRPALRLALPEKDTLLAVLRYGLPTLLRQGTTSLSGVLLSHVLARFGEKAIAGMGIAVRTLALISGGVIGFGQGFQPVCGVNLGAGRLDRVREAYAFCMKAVVLSLIILGALLFPLAHPLLRLFGTQEAAAAFGARVLRAQSVVLFAQGAIILMNMLTQSMGRPALATLVATSRQGIFFIPLLLILPALFGENGLIYAQSASDLVSLPFCWLLTRRIFDRQSVRYSSSSPSGYSDARKA